MFFVSFTYQATAQTDEEADKLITKVKKVFELAQKGYDDLDANSLITAARILINNPEIAQFKAIQVNDSSIPTQEEGLERHNFFDAATLLMDAEKIAPVDAWLIRKRITYWNKQVKVVPMNTSKSIYNGGGIQVKNYLVYSKNSKTIDAEFEKNKKVTLSVRVGDQLRLKVFDSTNKKDVGKSQTIGDAQLVSFIPKSDGVYKITIENTASRPNDCYLMIEQR